MCVDETRHDAAPCEGPDRLRSIRMNQTWLSGFQQIDVDQFLPGGDRCEPTILDDESMTGGQGMVADIMARPPSQVLNPLHRGLRWPPHGRRHPWSWGW